MEYIHALMNAVQFGKDVHARARVSAVRSYLQSLEKPVTAGISCTKKHSSDQQDIFKKQQQKKTLYKPCNRSPAFLIAPVWSAVL